MNLPRQVLLVSLVLSWIFSQFPFLTSAFSKERKVMDSERQQLESLDFTLIGPQVGDRFPDVVLPDQTGQVIDLHKVRNHRRALVVFYRSAEW
jgi:hypothetical protein